jgi:iron complex transport system substrate-binding protein
VGFLAAVIAAALAASPAAYVEGRQQADGGFAEPGRASSPQLTAWASIGLAAAGRPNAGAAAYLDRHEAAIRSATDLELWLLGETASGRAAPDLVARLRALARPGGAIGPTVNSTIWGVLALRQAGATLPRGSVAFLVRRQARSGGWAWSTGGEPDSNDTAAAIQALRAAGVGGATVRRGLAFLRRFQNRDGGFELTDGRGSDAQSTAWAIQALLSARERPGPAAYRYLARLRRPDGSYRYSAGYVTTPVWVTSQALAALAGRPLPLRS